MKKIIWCLLLVTFAAGNVYSQDDDELPTPDEPDVPPAPIDDSLPILVMVGVAYTSWKLVRKKNGLKEQL